MTNTQPTPSEAARMKLLRVESLRRLKYIEALDTHVDHVRSDGLAVLKTGDVVSREHLDKLINIMLGE